MQCADMWRYWSLSTSLEGDLPPVRTCPPTGLISDTCRNGGLLVQPGMSRRGGQLALVPVGHRGTREGRSYDGTLISPHDGDIS